MSAKKMQLGEVQQMIDNYKSNQLVSITTNPDIPMDFDAQSVWFSLESLKEFIACIEAQVALHPECPVNNLGMRFYYSAYSATPQAGVPSNYGKLHTLVAIPTTDIDGVNSDFDPYDKNTYDGKKPTDPSLGIMAENHGDLCPPLPASGLWF